MNEEKLRIAILKALGWTQTDFGSWITPGGNPAFDSGLFDPLASRDAAIAAVIELVKTHEHRRTYIRELQKVIGIPWETRTTECEFAARTATPLQICTALAKCLNLNVEE